MNTLNLAAHPEVLAHRDHGLMALARAVQTASRGQVAFSFGGMRLADRDTEAFDGLDTTRAETLVSELVEQPLRPGTYPLETLIECGADARGAAEVLDRFYRSHLPFVAADVVAGIEAQVLKIFLLGSAGTGVVSAVQDMVAAFIAAGYHGRAFPLFDPSKKGAPVRGYGVVGRDPIRSHAAFELPDIVLLFDPKLFALLRPLVESAGAERAASMSILVNSALTPAEFRAEVGLRAPCPLYTLDAEALLHGRRIPPNYAMIGGLLGMLAPGAVDVGAFTAVVEGLLGDKFGGGDKVTANLEVFAAARAAVHAEGDARVESAALGEVEPAVVAAGQVTRFEDGNRAIARATALVLDQFPSVVAAYPITPQTPIVEILAQSIADGELGAVSVTPESEHGAGGATLGAARDRVLAFTATSSQGFALMSEVVHTMAGLRMGNVLISNVLRSLNSPLDVENDHSDLMKVGLDAGYLVFMTRDVQQAFDFHLIAWLVSLYAEYRECPDGRLEMIPGRAVMLPAIVASEGFEVSHAPERYVAVERELAERIYADAEFGYVRTFVDTPNNSVMGTLQLSDSRHDTDYQRHVAMELALGVIEHVLARFAEYTGRHHGLLETCGLERSKVLFVVAGAANGSFEAVAREFARRGIDVAVAHPTVLRPFRARGVGRGAHRSPGLCLRPRRSVRRGRRAALHRACRCGQRIRAGGHRHPVARAHLRARRTHPVAAHDPRGDVEGVARRARRVAGRRRTRRGRP